MRSLEYITPKYIIEFTSLSRTKNTLIIRGQNMNYVTNLYMNGQEVVDFIRLSDEVIIASIPTNLLKKQITPVLYSSKKDRDAILVPEITGKAIEGMHKLIQRYVKYFLQSPNSNIFNKQGGGVLDMRGMLIEDKKQLTSKIYQATEIAKNAIQKEQKRYNLPPQERLLEVTIVSINMPQEDTLEVVQEITNAAGQTSSFIISP